MKIIKLDSGNFSIELSRDSLVIMKNCINDAADLMSEREFKARVGATTEEALDILRAINAALRS